MALLKWKKGSSHKNSFSIYSSLFLFLRIYNFFYYMYYGYSLFQFVPCLSCFLHQLHCIAIKVSTRKQFYYSSPEAIYLYGDGGILFLFSVESRQILEKGLRLVPNGYFVFSVFLVVFCLYYESCCHFQDIPKTRKNDF